MRKVRIDVYEGGTPAATISIPTWVLTGAANLLPRIGGKRLQDRIEIDQIVELLKNSQVKGAVFEIEDHKEKERVVISIVGDEEDPTRN